MIKRWIQSLEHKKCVNHNGSKNFWTWKRFFSSHKILFLWYLTSYVCRIDSRSSFYVYLSTFWHLPKYWKNIYVVRWCFSLKAYEIKRTAKKATSSVGGWYGNLYKYEPKLLRCKNRTRLMQVWKKLKTKNIYLIIRALFTFEFFMTLNFFFSFSRSVSQFFPFLFPRSWYFYSWPSRIRI